jgi:hypothetical protein
MRTLLRAIALVLFVSAAASAEVTRLDVTSRSDVSGYPSYERIAGRIVFSVNPADPRNAVIVDLDKAPRAANGRVEFTADFAMLRPKDGGNGTALVDIVNRGRFTVFSLNRGTAAVDRQVGDAFLMKRGFTIAAVGWEFDIAHGDGRLVMDAPTATENGKPIAGLVRGTFTPDRRDDAIAIGDVAPYTPLSSGADASLTLRDAPNGKPVEVPRAKWRFDGDRIVVDGGFEPGHLYELSYRAENPRVGGVGFLAVRDVASWLKHGADAPAHTARAYAFGVSQSGRFLRDFLYHGCNTDEQGRQAFDAMMIHIAGSSRLDLDRRWSTPASLGSYGATSFPFADAAQRDPVSGATEGEVDNARARQNQPKRFYTNTGVEYWGGARGAALLHVTADGAQDITPPPDVRIYFLAGAQHTPGAFPPAAPALTQQRANPTDYWWTMRALLVSLDRWVRDGAEPPASAFPKLADGTLVKSTEVAFPAIPGVHSPRTLWGGARVENRFVAKNGAGAPLPLLVPQVDADGNERAGVHQPEVTVPLATYTGWNFRDPKTGGADLIRPLIGSYIAFPATRADRDRLRDPRRSIDERYATRDAYLSRIKDAASELVKGRYLLEDDVPAIVTRATQHWDLAVAAPSTATAVR